MTKFGISVSCAFEEMGYNLGRAIGKHDLSFPFFLLSDEVPLGYGTFDNVALGYLEGISARCLEDNKTSPTYEFKRSDVPGEVLLK